MPEMTVTPEPIVTTDDFDESERAAWAIAISRGLSITAADLRAMLAAARGASWPERFPFAEAPRLPRAGNCPACSHLWRLHGPDGCSGKVYPAHSLTGEPCPCEHTPAEVTR